MIILHFSDFLKTLIVVEDKGGIGFHAFTFRYLLSAEMAYPSPVFPVLPKFGWNANNDISVCLFQIHTDIPEECVQVIPNLRQNHIKPVRCREYSASKTISLYHSTSTQLPFLISDLPQNLSVNPCLSCILNLNSLCLLGSLTHSFHTCQVCIFW